MLTAPILSLLLALAPAIQVDQVGYTPAEPKWAAIPHAVASARVRRVSDGALVLTVPVSPRSVVDPASGDSVYAADFTALATPGRYYVEVPGLGRSEAFDVDAQEYDRLLRWFLKGLYYQRCGTAIPAQYGGAWTHDVCHDHGPSAASYDWATTGGAPGNYRDTRGGWHDAGDFGKYSTNNDYAVGVLLQGYLLAPSRFAADDVGIPESHNGVPDLLDEARWGLAWMLKMQLPDGSVLHRESAATYTGMFLPEGDPATRYYTGVSSDATADHAAAMALAAQAFAPFDTAFAGACRRSALSAWAWLVAHPARVPAGGFANLYGHTGATYILGSEVGRRLWAAAEIFRLTGDANANAYVAAHWGASADFNGVWYPDGWGDCANLGAFTYRATPGANAGVVSGNWWSIANSTTSSADQWLARVQADGYGCAATTGDYYWGATGVFLRYAWTLIEAWRVNGNTAYLDAAREQLHYILGRNPMGKVYLTGIGAPTPVLHSHGSWNTAAGYTGVDDAACHPIPYLLIGGPNSADNPISPYPGKCYEDIADPNYGNLGNYTLNETAVNIQASIIALAGFFATGAATVGVEEPAVAVSAPAMRLLASPNPARGRVTLRAVGFAEATPAAPLRLAIYDVSGARVRELTTGADGGALFDGRDSRGRDLPTGIYFARTARGGAATPFVLVR